MGTRPPAVTPAAEIQLKYKQSSYDVLPKLPHTSCFLAKTGSFKSICMQWLILKGYRGAFEKIFVFSPSVKVDPVWKEVGKYCEDVLGQEKWGYDTPDLEALDEILETSTRVTEYLRKKIAGPDSTALSCVTTGATTRVSPSTANNFT